MATTGRRRRSSSKAAVTLGERIKGESFGGLWLMGNNGERKRGNGSWYFGRTGGGVG